MGPTFTPMLKVVIMITFGYIDRNGVLVSDESPYFSYYACEFLHATDVACKSYKRKRSESSVTTKFTTFESMDRLNVIFDISN